MLDTAPGLVLGYEFHSIIATAEVYRGVVPADANQRHGFEQAPKEDEGSPLKLLDGFRPPNRDITLCWQTHRSEVEQPHFLKLRRPPGALRLAA